LRVVDPAGGSVLVPSSVNVIPNGRNQGRISVRFEASDRVRGDGVNPFAVRIANTSTANGYAPLVTLRSRQAGTLLGISPTATTFESYQFLGIASEGPAGVYAPGETGAFHFYLSAGGSESAVDMRVISSEDTTPIDWGSLRDSLRPATIPVEAWGPIFENLTASITTWGEYVVLLNETAIALSLIGERVSDLQTLWAFHLRQAMNAVAPVPHLTSMVDGYLGLPGLPLGLDRTFGVTLADRYGVGLFGRGWVSSWDAQLERSADGMVRILGVGGGGAFLHPRCGHAGTFHRPIRRNGRIDFDRRLLAVARNFGEDHLLPIRRQDRMDRGGQRASGHRRVRDGAIGDVDTQFGRSPDDHVWRVREADRTPRRRGASHPIRL
jgi:hypothetical protein